MTYKERMEREHPIMDKNFVIFSCPGDYFEGAPATAECSAGMRCVDCWNIDVPEWNSKEDLKSINEIPDKNQNDLKSINEIPNVESSEKSGIDPKKVAKQVKALYVACRDEGLNHQEAFEITKIIIAEGVRSHDPSVF